MKVSQVKEVDTHAVIGGGAARSFSVSDSADFFGVLSSTLYRDGERAMVRETICNAWDAHVVAGKTDIPIEVTFTDDEFIIRDFGPGIPDHLIVPIYCVYGASTKVKDANQTGGFGLGSKSPFAYTDHFTTESNHAGERRVYAVSKGGASTEGKPEIREMVCVPTEETGLKVTIPLRNKGDRAKLLNMARIVAFQGGMKVKINGTLTDTVNYDSARSQGYCVLPDTPQMAESKAYLLYGTVLYPVLTTDEAIMSMVERAAGYVGAGKKLILVAPPNSIGVTPSRETLNYTELTQATIRRLLVRAYTEIKTAFRAAGKAYFRQRGAKLELDKLDHDGNGSYNDTSYAYKFGALITKPFEIATHAICQDFSRVDWMRRWNWLVEGAAQAHRELRGPLLSTRGRPGSVMRRLGEREYRRFIKMIRELGMIEEAFFYDDRTRSAHLKRLNQMRKAKVDKMEKVIYIAPNQRELTSLIIQDRDDPTDRSGLSMPCLAVGHKPSDDLLAKIRNVAEKYGYDTYEYDFDYVKPARAKKTVQVAKYHALEDYLYDGLVQDETLENPKFFLRCTNHGGEMRVGVAQDVRHMLKNMYPGLALITQKAQEEKLRKAGAINVVEDIAPKLAKLIKKREVHYGVMVGEGMFVEGNAYYHSSVTKMVLALAKSDNELAKMLFPDRVKLGDAWREAKVLLRMLEGITGDQELPVGIGIWQPAEVLATLHKNAKATYAHMIIDNAEAKERFRYLDMLVGSRFEDGNMSERDRLKVIGIIKYLQRDHSQSTLTSSNGNVAMKEAA